jgi:hypothetical protein
MQIEYYLTYVNTSNILYIHIGIQVMRLKSYTCSTVFQYYTMIESRLISQRLAISSEAIFKITTNTTCTH